MLIVWLGLFVSLENFSLVWRSPLRVKGYQCDLCSALMAIEHLGFLSVSHLLWHWTSVYDGNIRGPVTLASIAERFSSEAITTCFNDLGQLRLGCKHPIIRLRGHRFNPLCHCCGRRKRGRGLKLWIIMLTCHCIYFLLFDWPVDVQLWAFLIRSQCKVSDTQVTVKTHWPLFFRNSDKKSKWLRRNIYRWSTWRNVFSRLWIVSVILELFSHW